MKRPCIDCGTPTSSTRCLRCSRDRDQHRWQTKATTYDTAWKRHSADTRQAWVDVNGWLCPGYQRDAHASTDLVVDHDLGVLCRSCNAVKANTEDRGRGGGSDTGSS